MTVSESLNFDCNWNLPLILASHLGGVHHLCSTCICFKTQGAIIQLPGTVDVYPDSEVRSIIKCWKQHVQQFSIMPSILQKDIVVIHQLGPILRFLHLEWKSRQFSISYWGYVMPYSLPSFCIPLPIINENHGLEKNLTWCY